MKNTLLLLIFVAGISINSDAQLPNGSIAPDFTLTDRDGVTHNLYTYLDQGKVVFIKFFACHCPSCWAYHNTGKLESLYQTYGPDGMDQIMVLMLEHDQNNPEAFIGQGGYTQGDWTVGNSIPMVDVEGSDRSVFDDYNMQYYPMVMKVCSDKTVELMSTSYSVAELYQEADDCAGTLGIDAETKAEYLYVDQLNGMLHWGGFNEVRAVNIFNLSGQMVLNLDGDQNNQVDISMLENGVYLIQIAYSGGIFTKKIVL